MISLKKICITLVVALLFLVPAQYADAAIDASTLKKLFDQVDNESKWRTSSNKPDGYEITYTDGYVMRAYLLMYQSTGDKQYLNKFISFADSVLARRDNVVGKTDFRGLRLPGWSSNHFDPKQNMHYAMATGIIATPLAQFATVVKSDPALANYKTKANIYVQAAKDAMAIHDKPSNSQYIYSDNNWIEDSNTLYLRRPVNMNVAYGSALLAIYEATGDKAYYDKGKKIANYFKPLLTVNPSTSGYYWKYFPGHSSYGNVIEDLSHSTLGAEFAYLAYKNGIYNSTDMQRLANTANKTLAKSNGSVANRLDGSGVSTQPGLYLHWLWFEPWAPSILDKAYNIVKSRTSTYPMELTGIAMLNYFNSHGDVPAPGPDPEPDPDPEPTPPTDTQRPVVKINAPASGGQLNGTAVFQVSASDNVGVDNLVLGYGPSANGPWTEVKGASELKSGTDASGNWQLNWDVSGLKDGTYYVLAKAIDAAGNMGFSAPLTYEVKNQAQAPAPAGNLIENGDFSAGLQGWLNKNNSAKISRDSSGNPALTNTFNYDFFQEINLQPGNYKLNARTYAGTSQKAAMIVIMFYHRDGSHTTDYVFKHQHTGKGWQSINEMNIKVPATVVKARIFLTVESGDNGYHHFDDVTLTAVK